MNANICLLLACCAVEAEAEQTVADSGPNPHLGMWEFSYYILEWYLDEIQGSACATDFHRERVLMLAWEHLLSKSD